MIGHVIPQMKGIKEWNYIYLAQKLCFWTGIIFIGVYVSVFVSVCLSVCLCVCESLYRLTQKVLDRF